MKILVVKLSSLGDVVHTMPAVQDVLHALPGVEVDWVVERGFAPLVRRCRGVRRVIESDLRHWRRTLLAATTRTEWAAFRTELRAEAYDAIIDLQGLTKSAVVSRVARLADGGQRYAMANQTEGSSYERPTRWAADVAHRMEPRVHAVTRSRELCARSFGYEIPAQLTHGLVAQPQGSPVPGNAVAFVHGSSRADKCWPEVHWIALGRRLAAEGRSIALPHGTDEERRRSERIAASLGDAAQVWPRLPLDALVDGLAACVGVIGVDSGLSHIAVALGLPHVQLYNFDTAWRTGPFGESQQRAVFARPAPTVAAVWDVWRQVTMPG